MKCFIINKLIFILLLETLPIIKYKKINGKKNCSAKNMREIFKFRNIYLIKILIQIVKLFYKSLTSGINYN